MTNTLLQFKKQLEVFETERSQFIIQKQDNLPKTRKLVMTLVCSSYQKIICSAQVLQEKGTPTAADKAICASETADRCLQKKQSKVINDQNHDN